MMSFFVSLSVRSTELSLLDSEALEKVHICEGVWGHNVNSAVMASCCR